MISSARRTARPLLRTQHSHGRPRPKRATNHAGLQGAHGREPGRLHLARFSESQYEMVVLEELLAATIPVRKNLSWPWLNRTCPCPSSVMRWSSTLMDVVHGLPYWVAPAKRAHRRKTPARSTAWARSCRRPRRKTTCSSPTSAKVQLRWRAGEVGGGARSGHAVDSPSQPGQEWP